MRSMAIQFNQVPSSAIRHLPIPENESVVVVGANGAE